MDLGALVSADQRFLAVLAAVTPDDYGRPTPCEDWTVLQLVDHVVVGNLWAALILGGMDGRAAFDEVLARELASDRRAEGTAAAARQEAAFTAATPETLVSHRAGPMPARFFLGLRTADVVVHTWDLCRAVGAPEDIPAELVTAALPPFEAQRERLVGSGLFGRGADGAPPAGSDQERLLHLTGRRP
ncbi:MAG: hypothetical protein JWP61_1648 [Friedmanniella sp.]|nr:hypothetical protein [Friedmanniella sp.]